MKPLFSSVLSWIFILSFLIDIVIINKENNELKNTQKELNAKYKNLVNELKATNKLIVNNNIDTTNSLLALNEQSVKRDENLYGKITIIDGLIDASSKKKAEIKQVAEAIRLTAPSSMHYIEVCRNKLTPATINIIAASVIDFSYQYGVSKALVLGIIRRESGFCQEAVSRAGALGLMQLMPETARLQAKEIAEETGYSPKPWRIKDNIWLGTYYISKRLNNFNGNADLALKAYNAGINHVKQVLNGEKEDYYKEPKIYSEVVLTYKKEYENMGIN